MNSMNTVAASTAATGMTGSRRSRSFGIDMDARNPLPIRDRTPLSSAADRPHAYLVNVTAALRELPPDPTADTVAW